MKDFDVWNKLQKYIETKEQRAFFKEGDVWWCHVGLNIGYEIDGKGQKYARPVVVLKKYNQYSFLALPLSTSTKSNKFRISIGNIGGKDSTANLSQMRSMDSKRLIDKITHLDQNLFVFIKKKASEITFH